MASTSAPTLRLAARRPVHSADSSCAASSVARRSPATPLASPCQWPRSARVMARLASFAASSATSSACRFSSRERAFAWERRVASAARALLRSTMGAAGGGSTTRFCCCCADGSSANDEAAGAKTSTGGPRANNSAAVSAAGAVVESFSFFRSSTSALSRTHRSSMPDNLPRIARWSASSSASLASTGWRRLLDIIGIQNLTVTLLMHPSEQMYRCTDVLYCTVRTCSIRTDHRRSECPRVLVSPKRTCSASASSWHGFLHFSRAALTAAPGVRTRCAA